MNLQFLVGPVVGAIIGGITNGIAIKMLFRPINPVKIGKFTLPFTPGVIPKEKKRISVNVGRVVSSQLLNEEVLKEWLLKDEIIREINTAVSDYLCKCRENENTVNDTIAKLVGEDRTTFLICEIEEQITDKLYSKIVKMSLGSIIGDKIRNGFKEGSFSNVLGPMSFLINDGIVQSITSKMEVFINKYIENEGESIIRQAVEQESSSILSTPVSEYAEKLSKYEEAITNTIVNLYKSIVENHLNKILEKINISQIVEERIMSLDMLEIEKIILSIMRKELNAIVWFGVLLGGIMGLICNII